MSAVINLPRLASTALVVALVQLASSLPLARAEPPSDVPPLPPPAAPPPTARDFGAPEDGTVPGATATPPSDHKPPPKTDAELAETMRPAFRGSGGFQYAQVHGVPITAARARLGVGTQNDFGGHYGTVSALYGMTENDLLTWDLRAGYTGDLLRLGFVRLGLDAEVGYLVIKRASVDKRLWALGAGAGVHVTADLYAFGPRDDHAITAEVRFDAYIHFGGAPMWGPSLMLGFRY